MNTHFTYFLILAISIAGPLCLSFDKKVAFYKKWPLLLPAMLLPAVFYIIWDVYFTSIGIWEFNPAFIIGKKWLGLPVEEWLFFIIIPYCSIFIYECVRCYFPKLSGKKWADVFLQLVAIFLLVAAIYYRGRMYTVVAFVFCSMFIGSIYFFRSWFKNFDAASFLVAFLIVLVPFMIVNGFLTALPVLIYNDAENSGIRITTIPFEDVFYGMLLILMNVTLFEKRRAEKQAFYQSSK